METQETAGIDKFSQIYFFLILSFCFFSFSSLLILSGDGIPYVFLMISFIALLSGLFCGAAKIISWESREKNEYTCLYHIYITN